LNRKYRLIDTRQHNLLRIVESDAKITLAGVDKAFYNMHMLFCILIIACSMSVSVQATEVPSDNIPLSLAIRLLTPISDVPNVENTQVFVGELPDKMPVELPIPKNAKILGSMVTEEACIDILFDVNQTSEQVFDFYRESLANNNWSEVGQSRGIVWGSDRITFCRGLLSPSLTVSAYTVREGPTEVRLNVNTDQEKSLCIRDDDDYRKPLPKLVAPFGVRQYGTSGNYMGTSTIESTTLNTDMNSSALEIYFSDQLKEANWTRLSGGQNGPLAWSTWIFMDEDGLDWSGQLFALEIPKLENQRWVLVQASLAESHKR